MVTAKLVVLKKRSEKDHFLVSVMKQGKALKGFHGVEDAKVTGFFAGKRGAEKEFLTEKISKIPRHENGNTRNGESGKRKIC